MKKIIRIILIALLLCVVSVSAFACSSKDKYISFTMQVNDNDEFKILQLTDIHFINSDYTNEDPEMDLSLRDEWAMTCIRDVVERSQPDMIMVTGDSVYNLKIVKKSRRGLNTDNLASFKKFADFIDSFGNHDEEGDLKDAMGGDKIATKQALSSYLISDEIEHCMYVDGPDNITGVGNYIITVNNKDGSLNNALVVFDSGSYLGEDQWCYDCVHDDQLDWYQKAIKHIARLNKTKNISSIVFQHIPFKEYREALDAFTGELKDRGLKPENVIRADGKGTELAVELAGAPIIYHGGVYNEGEICCSYEGYWQGQHYNGGNEFQKILDVGSTKAVFCGHDHRNTFSFTYQGIRITYGMSVDYSANGLTPAKDNQTIFDETVQRGGTLITLRADSSVDVEQVPFTRNLYREELAKRGLDS